MKMKNKMLKARTAKAKAQAELGKWQMADLAIGRFGRPAEMICFYFPY